MIEFINVLIIGLISDLDNVIIYLSIIKRYTTIPLAIIITGLIATCRTFYVSVIHQLYDFPAVQLIIGIILLFMAIQMTIKQVDLFYQRSPSFVEMLFTILVFDFFLSMDGIILVSTVADSSISVFFGISFSLFLLLMFSPLLLNVMNYFPWIFIIVAAFIGYTAMISITNEQIVSVLLVNVQKYFPLEDFSLFLSRATAIFILLLGIISLWQKNKMKTVGNNE